MRLGYRITFIGFLIFGLLTQFTNCDVYSENGNLSTNSVLNCADTSCVVSNSDNLEISVKSEDIIPSGTSAIDVGGDCNEGAFAVSKINWTLLNAGTVLATCAQNNSCGQCLSGRYQVRVTVPGAVVVTGMQVIVEIKGVDLAGTEYPGRPTLARRTMNIRPP